MILWQFWMLFVAFCLFGWAVIAILQEIGQVLVSIKVQLKEQHDRTLKAINSSSGGLYP